MNLGTKITIYKFTPQVFTLTPKTRQGQSENCFSNVLAKRVWLHLLNVPL